MFKIVVFLAVLSISLAMPTGDQEITMLNFFEPKPGEPTIQERHSVDATTVTMTLYTDSATCGGANTIKVSCTAGCTKKTTSFKSLKISGLGNDGMTAVGLGAFADTQCSGSYQLANAMRDGCYQVGDVSGVGSFTCFVEQNMFPITPK